LVLSVAWLRGRGGGLRLNLISWKPQILRVIALLAGVSLPFIVVREIPVYHLFDYTVFSTWAECWSEYGAKIYLNCRANYPFVGIVATAGALSTLKTLLGDGYPELIKSFHFYLAIFDALNFILVWLIARALKLKYALGISLLIAALPSTWAGGALWGQIDDVSQFFLLASVLCFVKSTQSNSDRLSWHSVAFCFFGIFASVMFILTKQLAVFSLPALLPLALLACLRLWTSGTKFHGAMAAGLALLSGVIFFWFLDSRLEVPSIYHGLSYLFVWISGGGPSVISANGFNIWMLLGRDMWSSPKEPFYCLRSSGYQFCLTPSYSGLMLYGIYLLALSALNVALIFKLLQREGLHDQTRIRFMLAVLIMYIAQANLGLNVFLVGTHERYLYHCFPFLILAAFYFSEYTDLVSWRSIVLFVTAAILYGAFVFMVLIDTPLIRLLRVHEITAALFLLLLIYLCILSLKLYNKSIRIPPSAPLRSARA